MKPFIVRLAIRESEGGALPGAYLPVSTPCASGDQTIWEIPFAAQRGITSPSGLRQSIEYCGCEETNFSTRGARSSAAWIWPAFHSEKALGRGVPCPAAAV